MKIAQFAPLAEAVPPILYGGIERVVSALTEALVRQGHEVTLFASGDSKTSAKLIPICKQAIRLNPPSEDPWPGALEVVRTHRAELESVDMLHFHTELLSFPLFRSLRGRCITTVHMPAHHPEFSNLFTVRPNTPVVSVSRYQRLAAPELNWIDTVHDGLPLSLLTSPARSARGYLAFLGRISPEKGPDVAIQIARRAGLRLKIAAKVGPADRSYFEQHIEPLIDGTAIEFIGEIGDEAKADFLGHARGLLFPIAWPEPFGLCLIEAMACGLPIIAFPQGAVPELIEDGITGFVVPNVDEAVRAVDELDKLDRRLIRQRFEARFSDARMARDYLGVYARLLTLPPDQL